MTVVYKSYKNNPNFAMTSLSVGQLKNLYAHSQFENLNFWARLPKVTSYQSSCCFCSFYILLMTHYLLLCSGNPRLDGSARSMSLVSCVSTGLIRSVSCHINNPNFDWRIRYKSNWIWFSPSDTSTVIGVKSFVGSSTKNKQPLKRSINTNWSPRMI